MASVRAPREQQLSLVYEILTNTRKYNVSYTPQAKANIQDHLDALLLVRPPYNLLKFTFLRR